MQYFLTQRRKMQRREGSKAFAKEYRHHQLVSASWRSGCTQKLLCFLRDFAPLRLCVEFNCIITAEGGITNGGGTNRHPAAVVAEALARQGAEIVFGRCFPTSFDKRDFSGKFHAEAAQFFWADAITFSGRKKRGKDYEAIFKIGVRPLAGGDRWSVGVCDGAIHLGGARNQCGAAD